MIEIGQKLKARREELGLTIENIQEETKIARNKIKAIESGDLDYFKHELSYLKFYVQYYSQSLGIAFEEIEDDLYNALDTYSETIMLKREEKREISNDNIQKRMEKNKEQYRLATRNLNTRKRRRLDFSTLGLLILSVIIIALLIFGLFKFVVPLFNPSDTINEPIIPDVPAPPVVDDNDDNDPVVEEPDDKEPVTPAPQISIEQGEPVPNANLAYTITLNGVEDGRLRIEFGSTTWIQVSVDDVVTNNPSSGIYNIGESVEVLLNDQQQSISIRVGTMVNNVFFINNQQIEIPEEAATHNSGFTILFNID